MKLNNLAIPGKSMAGISLRNDVDIVAASLAESYKIEKENGVLSISDGMLLVGYNSDNRIYAIECNQALDIVYANKLWAGMSVRDVLKHSSTQVALGGCVVVDNINGIGLPLPSDFDDFECITDYLSQDYVFERLSVFLF
ncbi:hypothetical protein [Caballeronia sp. LZ032]|uniref:hypothetical protein n=1 Tax=Caballeronia sp. LZ032 TaxID=3038565 RepID=UPI002855BE3C|nr:hypothetical protein [Caballeronia sp. LZ032]MDR5884262.1 hypothetical protein [Caballeronia sp. LZ032]